MNSSTNDNEGTSGLQPTGSEVERLQPAEDFFVRPADDDGEAKVRIFVEGKGAVEFPLFDRGVERRPEHHIYAQPVRRVDGVPNVEEPSNSSSLVAFMIAAMLVLFVASAVMGFIAVSVEDVSVIFGGLAVLWCAGGFGVALGVYLVATGSGDRRE